MTEKKVRPPRSAADETWREAPEGAHEWMSFPDPDDEQLVPALAMPARS